MITLQQMQSSNARIDTLGSGLVAIFVGGTSGIGEATMKEFAKQAVQPRIYFIGRSEEAAERIKIELESLNPGGQYHFIQTDVSLLANVDNACRDIQSKETLINLLFLTSGTTVTGIDTAESLYYPTAVTYYSRIRFISNLLPFLQRATSLRRVVTVFNNRSVDPKTSASTLIQPHNVPSGPKPLLSQQSSAIMTLALESLALEAPDVTFIHSFPSPFSPATSTTMTPTKPRKKSPIRSSPLNLVRAVFLKPILSSQPKQQHLPPVNPIPIIEAGERQLFVATSARYPAKKGGDVRLTAGVSIESEDSGEWISVARGTDGKEGTGVYLVGPRGCDGGYDGRSGHGNWGAAPLLLKELREKDMMRRLWLHTVAEFTRVTGSVFM
ncbi:3-keto-steroid reductase [Podospora fimiseda]|uniref:3-keto-steroid reductase n=1 Tax=Podospora fimiseda TaxID=252190 RepID=A0AAN7BPA2_9PEZI|nr:3-keto-steroid reductase [Podospora fimiseda]